MRRRTFLAAAGGGTLSLAGCSRVSRSNTADGIPAPPTPDRLLHRGGWARYDDWVRELYSRGIVVGALTATAHTVKYEDRQLRRRVREDTLGTLDRPLKVFFASRVVYDPPIDDIPLARTAVLERTERHARDRFVRSLERRGISDVTARGSGSIAIDAGQRADLFTYRGVYRFESLEVPLRQRATLTIQGGSLPINGLVAVWDRGEDTLIAGGAYPAADLERASTTDLSDAIELTVRIDLGLTPGRYRDELRALVRGVG